MRVLYLTSYYEPEVAASLYLFSNICEALVKNGHVVDVVTPIPTRGVTKEIRKKYSKLKIESLFGGSLLIHRFWLPNEKKKTIIRVMRYITLNIILLLKALTFKPDLIFIASTPPTNGVMAAILKKIKKVPIVYNLQDIFPDSLVNTKIATEKSLPYKIGRRMEEFTYENVDRIVVISEDFKKNLLEKGVLEEKIDIVYNWVDENAVVPIDRTENFLFDKFSLEKDKFYVVYAGNLGNAQNVDIILKAAEETKEIKNINYVIFGKGAKEAELREKILEYSNVKLLPLEHYKNVSQVYSLGDVSVVSCKKGFGKSAMPSKTWSIMSAGTAVLSSFDKETDLERIIEENEVGFFTESENNELFIERIKQLYYNPELCKKMGRNGREYILKNLTKEIGTQNYVRIFEKLTKERNRKI